MQRIDLEIQERFLAEIERVSQYSGLGWDKIGVQIFGTRDKLHKFKVVPSKGWRGPTLAEIREINKWCLQNEIAPLDLDLILTGAENEFKQLLNKLIAETGINVYSI